VWACRLVGVSIADFAINWEDSSDSLRAVSESLFGGIPAEVPERYR